MRSSLLDIYNIYDRQEYHLAKDSVSFDRKNVESIISSIYSPGPSFIYIFDFQKKEVDFVSDSMKDLFGIKPSEVDPAMLFEIVHPEDLEFFVKAEDTVAKFLFQEVDKSDFPFYKVSYCLRLGNPSKNIPYQQYLHQAVTLTVDEAGNMSKVLGHQSNISHITTNNHYKISFLGLDGRPSFYNLDPNQDLKLINASTKQFTNREIEILRLISEGMQSKEIANHLFLSYDTIRTHRNNILKKYEFKNIPQAIAFAIREGLM